jgi:crossover junction endodeoxyribonuclease RuvC
MNRILGIDPGTTTMGYGVVEGEGEGLSLVNCGVLTAPPSTPMTERLHHLYLQLLEVISHCQPDEVAIEEPFVAKNVRSALAVGRAQAVAILAAASKGIPVYLYSPARVKQQVANYGAGDKHQVQQMVKLQLGLPDIPRPDDAADALAIAICHVHETRLSRLLAAGE